MAAIFISYYLTQVNFVSTVLVTDLVVSATFLLIIAGCLLVLAAFCGFIAVIVTRPPAVAVVSHSTLSLETID